MRLNERTLLVLGALLVGLLTGCQSISRPDLKRLYALDRGQTSQPPVVLVHGLLGSRLESHHAAQKIWPGSVWKALFSDYDDLALPINPQTLEPMDTGHRVTGITDQFGGQEYYGKIIRTLQDIGNYRRTEIGTAVQNNTRRLYLFTYDWRQDNVLAARKLSRFIEQIRRDHADPDLEVDIIAHSMGGLVARYYLRYGEVDVTNDNEFPVSMHGASRVRRVILLGTPNLGTAESLRSLIAGRKVALGRIKPEVLITMPSIYQLIPHALDDWIVTAGGKLLARDQFDVYIWRRFQWAIFDPEVRERIRARFDDIEAAQAHIRMLETYFEKHLERARRFTWSLTVPVHDPIPLIVFGGDCHLTPARIVVEEVRGESKVRLWPEEITMRHPGIDYEALMLEPGDGVVTKSSLLSRQALDPGTPRHRYIHFPLDYSFFLCERHDQLTGNISFQDNLLHALFTSDPRL